MDELQEKAETDGKPDKKVEPIKLVKDVDDKYRVQVARAESPSKSCGC